MAQTRITSRSLQFSSVSGENLVDGAITNPKIATNTIDVSKISNTALQESTPIGTIIWYTAETPPDGYLFADGSVVKRTSYQQLFNVIGTSYNTGNEANDEFRLPDLRGQFIRGWDNTGTVDRARLFGSKQEEDWKSFYMENVGQNVGFGTEGNVYSHSWNYQGKSTTGYIGNVFGGWWSANAAAIGVRWDHYESRPENIALSPCIKFGNVLKAKNTNFSLLNGGKFQIAIATNSQIYNSEDYGVTWAPREFNRNWSSVAISADGRYQSATVNNGKIYISNNYGITWTPVESDRSWTDIAMSADGRYQTATVINGRIYISSNYGITWTPVESDRSWRTIAISSDGSYQIATIDSSTVYTSNDYGNNWTTKSYPPCRAVFISSDGKYQAAVDAARSILRFSNNYGVSFNSSFILPGRFWQSVAFSSDGKYQTAVGADRSWPDPIQVSDNYGASWTARESDRGWTSVSMSSDGRYQTAVAGLGFMTGGLDRIYTSSDFGVTWTPRESNRDWRKVALNAGIATLIESKVSKSNPLVDGNLFINGNFSKKFQIGIKSGAASFVSANKNRWVKGFQMGDYVDAKSNTDGIVIRKSGYYEVIAWQRGSNNGGNPYIAISLNGDRATLENRADGIWTHSHTGGLAYNYSWSMYYGFLNVNEIICAGPIDNTTVSGAGYLMYSAVANTGYTGGLMIKSLNSYV